MKSWHEFITMGGYAAYVWPSYFLALIVLAVNIIGPRRQHKRLLTRLKTRLTTHREC